MDNYELYHHGVKGMRWGVRRYQNADGSLTNAGIKKYAKKGYAEDAMRSNKTVAGKVYDAYTGAHKITAGLMYDTSSKKKNRERAEQYVKEQNKKALLKASARAKRKADIALRKIEKQNKKDFVKSRSKEILKGEKAVGKIWDILTDAHKIQAEMEYDLRRRKD